MLKIQWGYFQVQKIFKRNFEVSSFRQYEMYTVEKEYSCFNGI